VGAILFNQDVHLRLKRSDPLQVKVERPAHLDQEILDTGQSRGDRPDHRRHDEGPFDTELLLRRISSCLQAFWFSDGGLQCLGTATKFVHCVREFTRKYLRVVALFDQDGDVALKFLARSSHAATSSRLSKEMEERSAFPRPFHGSRRESPQVFGVKAPFLENCVDHTMRR